MISNMILYAAAAAGVTFFLLLCCCCMYYRCCRKRGRQNSKKAKLESQITKYREGYEVLASPYKVPGIAEETLPIQDANKDTGGEPYPPPAQPSSHSATPPIRSMWPQDEDTKTDSGTWARGKSLANHKDPLSMSRKGSAVSLSPQELKALRSQSLPLRSQLENSNMARRRSFMAHEVEYDPLKEPSLKSRQITSLPPSLLASLSSLDSAGSSELGSKLGRIQLRVEYVVGLEVLRFHLVKAVDLPAMDAGGSSDPYVEISLIDTKMLLADGQVLRKFSTWRSKVHDKTLFPVFDEQHDFECPQSVPTNRLGFLLHVYDHDVVSKDDLIGHVWFPLKDVDLSLCGKIWKSVDPGKRIRGNAHWEALLGEIDVSLTYEEEKRHLVITVHRARSLPIFGATPPDTSAKVRLYHRDYKLASKETPKVRQSYNPEYNKVFHYQLSKEANIRQMLISVTVLNTGVLSKKPVGTINIGIGANAHPTGVAQWRDLLGAEAAATVSATHKLHTPMPVEPA